MATSIVEGDLPKTPRRESCSEMCLSTRIPILDAHNTVRGYELLCRGGFDSSPRAQAKPSGEEPGQAPGQSLERLSRGLWVIVPSTPTSLVSSGVIGLPACRTVLQLPANSEQTPELVEACRTIDRKSVLERKSVHV